MKQNYKLRGNQKLYILPISDLHIGSEQFNEQYWDYYLDTIDNIKQQKRIYICGDLLEAANKQTGNAAFHTTMTLNKQIDTAIDYFKPYRKDIVVAINGNHEARPTKDHDFNPVETIANALRCPVANQYLDEFSVNGNLFRVYARHGKGRAAYSHLAQGKIKRETQRIEADLFMEGHNHRLDFFKDPIRTTEGIGVKRRYYAFTGSFLRYNGYADAMTLDILPEAFQIININKDMIMRSTDYCIDEVRPDLFKM